MLSLPSHYFIFILTSLIASAFPGVAVIGCFTTGLKQGFKAAISFSLGLVFASVFYFILSALGLILLIEKYQYFFILLKYLGIIYLFYLGIQSLKEKSFHLDLSNNSKPNYHLALFVSAFFINFTNPKNLLFFIAILPQYINVEHNVNLQMFWLCLGAEIPEFSILIGYAYFAKQIKPVLTQPRVGFWFNKITGFLFIALAIFLLIMH